MLVGQGQQSNSCEQIGPRDPVDTHVGKRVRLRREELGLSQTALGERLDVTYQQVQKYEKGANRISASRLALIAEVLRVPVSYFFPPTQHAMPDPLASVTDAAALLLLRMFDGASKDVRAAVLRLLQATQSAPSAPQPSPHVGGGVR